MLMRLSRINVDVLSIDAILDSLNVVQERDLKLC
jgi:hypothetical protein